jgi:hypothetical protein
LLHGVEGGQVADATASELSVRSHLQQELSYIMLHFHLYSEFFLRLAIGFYMLIFQPPVNFCSDENIQTIFGIKLEDFLNYRIDYNSISQTVEKVVKKIFFSAPKASKIGDRQVLVEHRCIKLDTAMRCGSSSRRETYVSHSQPHKDFISAIL